MRIIAGVHRGRKLLPPPTEQTRPITDRVKQSLFDILTPYLPDAIVYDVFAGTGSLGLEALSRGAAQAWFFEQERGAITRLKQNLATIGMIRQGHIVAGDVFRQLEQHSNLPAADLVFFDPPYRFLTERPGELRRLIEGLIAHAKPAETLFTFRHDAADALPLPGLSVIDTRTYGGMTLEFLKAGS